MTRATFPISRSSPVKQEVATRIVRLVAACLVAGSCAASAPPPGAGAGGRGDAPALDGGVGAEADGAADAPAPRDAAAPTPDATGPTDSTAAPGDTSAEASPPAGACGGLALCDDFEGAAVGAPPDPARWKVGAPDLTGTGTLAIDDAQHHSGARAVKVTGQGGYSNHIFLTNTSAIHALGPVVWGRFYVRLSDPLGDGHATFLAMADGADGGKHVRMGGQSKILMWNRESDDATLPALSPAGIAASRPLPTGTWLCVEFTIDATAAPSSMRTWVDGAEVAGLHLDATPTPDVDEPWLRKPGWRPALTDFALGWESYAGQAMTLWFDDVALGAARVGCL